MKIKDIAQRAGVSTATVSNVINGNHHKVSQATVEKVRRIIEEHGYQPSATARSLASKESRIIGVVIPNLGEEEDYNRNPYISELIALLERYVRKQGYYLMIRSVRECREIVPVFSGWNVDGVILLGVFHHEVEEIEKLLKVPTIYADTYAKDLNIANVGVDDYKGGYLMARYLLDKGHRKIAFVGPNVEDLGVIPERYRGFCAALGEQGITLSPEDIFEARTVCEDGVAAGKRIAHSGKGFTAVAAMSDSLAMGLMAGLRVSGWNVPEDISLIGFENLQLCQFTNPPLTSISQSVETKVDLVGEHLFRMIREKQKIAMNVVLDVELIERQTVKQI